MGYVIEHLGKSLPLCGVYFFIHKWQGRTTANGRLRSPRGRGSPVTVVLAVFTEQYWRKSGVDVGGYASLAGCWGVPLTPGCRVVR